MATLRKATKVKDDWISVAFDDFGASFDGSSQSSLSGTGCAADGKPRKRRRDDNGVGIQLQSQTTARLTQVFGSSRRKDNTQLWVDKYAPKTKNDIVVHKKKVEEVESCLLSSLRQTSKKGCDIILLTGAAGTGKTATMRVLAAEHHLNLQEWSNPTVASSDEWQQRNMDSFSDYHNFGIRNESLSVQFRDFLLRADRYQSLQLTDEYSTQKVILVEEFPNQFYRDTSQFHDVIRNYKHRSTTPLVFIVSDSAGGDSNARRLFPPDIQAELSIINISFNPVAPTMMTKVLQKIASMESAQGGQLTKSDLDPLVTGSSGDIRAAINALQFSGQSSRKNSKTSKGTTRQRGKASTKLEKSTSVCTLPIGGRDNSLFLFRALGKILYCKRGDPKDFPAESPLPERYSEHARAPLLVDPEDVVERSSISGAFFLAYLHQNYLDFFQNLDDVIPASGYLSDADILSADWVSRIAMQEYSASVATRGLMHCNNVSSGGQSGRGWKPLHKPAWFGTMKKARENSAAARDLFRIQTWSPVDLQMQTLPFMAIMNPAGCTAAQRGVIKTVGCIQRQTYGFRGGGDRLDEKDVDLMESDDEPVVSANNQESSSAPGSPSIVEEPLVDDDDFVIEEFDD